MSDSVPLKLEYRLVSGNLALDGGIVYINILIRNSLKLVPLINYISEVETKFNHQISQQVTRLD